MDLSAVNQVVNFSHEDDDEQKEGQKPSNRRLSPSTRLWLQKSADIVKIATGRIVSRGVWDNDEEYKNNLASGDVCEEKKGRENDEDNEEILPLSVFDNTREKEQSAKVERSREEGDLNNELETSQTMPQHVTFRNNDGNKDNDALFSSSSSPSRPSPLMLQRCSTSSSLRTSRFSGDAINSNISTSNNRPSSPRPKTVSFLSPSLRTKDENNTSSPSRQRQRTKITSPSSVKSSSSQSHHRHYSHPHPRVTTTALERRRPPPSSATVRRIQSEQLGTLLLRPLASTAASKKKQQQQQRAMTTGGATRTCISRSDLVAGQKEPLPTTLREEEWEIELARHIVSLYSEKVLPMMPEEENRRPQTTTLAWPSPTKKHSETMAVPGKLQGSLKDLGVVVVSPSRTKTADTVTSSRTIDSFASAKNTINNYDGNTLVTSIICGKDDDCK
eukprot:CAMPEP_0172492244 /NCGR_PEP_ID=MMETSP1066-20121228/23325_1 /TAXON_ID=671091 /ORGANISM="Coscinodiscus wailesii, Strain CCMP2513" /LENGTH=444 /DNA_ID=CAMNT_0013261753 /DNA_START=166 /DNA_END=1501 /DNA_ORIENTATION=-